MVKNVSDHQMRALLIPPFSATAALHPTSCRLATLVIWLVTHLHGIEIAPWSVVSLANNGGISYALKWCGFQIVSEYHTECQVSNPFFSHFT